MPDASGAAPVAARDTSRPPRDDLVRALRGGVALRAVVPAAEAAAPSANANGMPTLYGHFARFNEWTEIDSWYEGHFMERVAPGSCRKTFKEQAQKPLFQHGADPQIGDKVLGPVEVLREDDEGAYYEVPLLDTSYNRDLVPGLEAGLYGASFRFSVMREDFVKNPGASKHNPDGLPERTIKEMRVAEFGPVTFPAYGGATAGVRSMTDEWLAARMTSQPERLRAVLAYLEQRDGTQVQRMDSEDVGTLAAMLQLASDYIEEQDEMDATEASNATAMQGVQATLIGLLGNEAAENEPEEQNASTPDGVTRDDDAAPGDEPTPRSTALEEDRVETASHPVGQSRDTATQPASLIYGMRRKETTTPWRL